MRSILAIVTNWKMRRSVEIALIMVFLLLLFSVVGVPMVLLSTFPPSWRRDGLETNRVDVDEIDGLHAPAAL